jgi:hypothetical protein
MPKVKYSAPNPSREKGQRSLDPENMFLWKLVPGWMRPAWYDAEFWRRFVLYQPVAIDCREAIISWHSSMDWKLEPRESTERDELKEDIRYYEELFSNNGDFDFIELIEWLGTDYLDIPFGAGVEVGRAGDSPDGKVLWIEPLDGGTLFPSLNDDFPVGQALLENFQKTVYFPKHAINRMYVSPRTKIERKGWGMPPPEKIYLAMEMLNRGDKYYAQLLLDTPEAGILDLMDMSKESATEWVKAFKSLMTGLDGFKVPILYEHEQAAKFIPFGRPPTEILFGQITAKYAALVCSAYGISPSDINFPSMGNGGETLAGSIRQERQTRRTGIARAKKKFKYFFDRLLPKGLQFSWIDLDDELSVALGRARLATATAFTAMVDKRIITPKESRLQLISDGLFTISMPEDIDEKEFDILTDTQQNPFGATAQRPGMLGKPVPPSMGGQGEVKKSVFEEEVDYGISRLLDTLETKSDVFAFFPDIDNIADEWLEFAPKEKHEEIKEQIKEYVKNTVPDRFVEAYNKSLETLELEDNDVIAEKVGKEIANMRYNLVDDFSKEVINIVKGK